MKEKEVTPIIIDSGDEIPLVIDLETKPEFDTQLQDALVAQNSFQMGHQDQELGKHQPTHILVQGHPQDPRFN